MPRVKMIVLALAGSLLAGCAAYLPMDAGGMIYRDVKLPKTATGQPMGTKVGTAQATSILGLVNLGDASIQTAAMNGGILHISSVDYETTQVLGVYATYTVIVHGN